MLCLFAGHDFGDNSFAYVCRYPVIVRLLKMSCSRCVGADDSSKLIAVDSYLISFLQIYWCSGDSRFEVFSAASMPSEFFAESLQ